MDGHRTYHVVVDDTGHHSIWAEGRAVPRGWRATGISGSKRECLDHVTRAWLGRVSRPTALLRDAQEAARGVVVGRQANPG